MAYCNQVRLLRQLDHPNLLKVMGVCIRNDLGTPQVWLLYPLPLLCWEALSLFLSLTHTHSVTVCLSLSLTLSHSLSVVCRLCLCLCLCLFCSSPPLLVNPSPCVGTAQVFIVQEWCDLDLRGFLRKGLHVRNRDSGTLVALQLARACC